MRCPKCGRTSHDYLKRCMSCSTDLTGQAALLGVFFRQKEDFSWFAPPTGDFEGKKETSPGPGPFRPDLSSIDVSDLTINEESSPAQIAFDDIKPEDLELIASDENFQKAVSKAVEE